MERDQYKEKTFTTSKLHVISTGIIFVVTMIFVAILYLTGKIADGFDTAAIVSMITVSGSIFGSTLVWYSKKAAAENQFKLRIALYHDAAVTRLNFNEEMMKLKQKYDMSDEDIEEIESDGEADEMMDSALTSVIEGLDTARDTSESENTIENI